MKRISVALSGLVLAAGVFGGAINAQAETLIFVAALNPAAEVPPKDSKGTGTVQAAFDTKSNKLHYEVTYKDLTGAATAAHFHGPAAIGQNAGVAQGLTGSLASPISGDVTLTSAQVGDLMAGKWYFNIHTAANPGGEIRGQLDQQK